MADTKTSDETAASALDGSELVRIVQGGTNAKATTQDIADLAATVTPDNDTTLASDSTTEPPTVHAVRGFVANAVVGLLELKGVQDCSANPNYPAASKGDAYLVSVAGKIGGASGVSVDAGDLVFATADNAGGDQATVGSSWASLEHNGVFGGGGGGSPLEVQDEGSTETAAAVSLNFTGAGVTANDDGSGNVEVNIPGGGGGTGAWAKLDQVVLAATAATIDFSSIPSTYEDLIVVLHGRGTNATADVLVTLQVNGDTGSNYDYCKWNRFGSVPAVGQTSATLGSIVAGSAPAGNASQLEAHFANYKRTTFRKTWRATDTLDESAVVGGQFPEMVSGLWRSTAAINRLTLALSAGNFDVGTVATLYGRG